MRFLITIINFLKCRHWLEYDELLDNPVELHGSVNLIFQGATTLSYGASAVINYFQNELVITFYLLRHAPRHQPRVLMPIQLVLSQSQGRAIEVPNK